jgi:ketosteroid isomerase-like protein
MASPNVELVRSIYAAWAHGDWSSTEELHPEIEYVIADGPAPGSWTGLAGMAEANRDFLGAWEGLRVVVDECRELDDERVLLLTRYSGSGKASGLELGQMAAAGAALFHIRVGKVTRLVTDYDRERALADLDLPSEAGSP